SVSHDLRAPLRHIVGFIGLLESHIEDKLDEEARKYLNTISKAARNMRLLIDDLLSFSKMGRAEMMQTDIDLEPLLQEVIRDAQPESERKIHWEIAPLPRVKADPSLIRQVLVNLVTNAIKYTRPRELAKIEIGAQGTKDETIIYVRDNGVGFDMKYADKLFGVFQRLHRAEDFEGTGIGLANVRRVISRHNGRTWAESKPDEGSTFYFSLPKFREKQTT